MKLAGIELPRVLAEALADCRQHFIAAAVFSLLINILYLAPTLYMLQIYDRVVPTGGKTTLLFVTMALALAEPKVGCSCLKMRQVSGKHT